MVSPPCRQTGGGSDAEVSFFAGIQLMQPVKGLLKASKSKQTRARWGLAYTLLNNPSLLACRKTVLSDPTANGTQSRPAKP